MHIHFNVTCFILGLCDVKHSIYAKTKLEQPKNDLFLHLFNRPCYRLALIV